MRKIQLTATEHQELHSFYELEKLATSRILFNEIRQKRYEWINGIALKYGFFIKKAKFFNDGSVEIDD